MQRVQIPRGQQFPQHPGFVAPDQPYSCRSCINFHGERFGFPALDPENEEVWAMYFTLNSQVRVGMDIIGLDYAALPPVFDLLGIPHGERHELFQRLVIMDREAMDHRAREAEQEKQKREMEKSASQNRTLFSG